MHQPAILCDIGNVIVSFDFSIASRQLAAQSDCPEDRLLDQLHDLKLPFEDGQIDDTTFVTSAMEVIGFRGSAAEFENIWCRIFTANTAMNTTLTQLALRHPLHLLSNTSGLHKDYLFAQYPVFNLFQSGVYSYSAKASKPSQRIFEIAIEQLDLDPAQTFYIDDLLPNIETAQALGFTTHLYDLTRHHELEAALASWAPHDR
jgi:putative hydrolase of the HAD superfamily